MKKMFLGVCVGLLALQACNNQAASEHDATSALPPPNPQNEPVAVVRGDVITRGDLDSVLVQAYGLNILLTLVQRDLVQQEAANLHVVVTPQDIANEKTITLEDLRKATEEVTESGEPSTQPDVDLTPDQEEALLDQVLKQKNLSRTEFDLVLDINAYLRKIAGPAVTAHLTEAVVRQHFNEMYGEKLLVHYIVCNNMTDAADVRRDLAAGKSFEDVARARSLDRKTAYNGGELPPFTLQDNRFPAEFRQVASNLKKGEVSDPIQIEKFIYIVKLVDRIPPAHAKFENYRDVVQKDLYDKTVAAAMGVERQQLAKMALDSMHIEDSVLQRQWEARVAQRDGQIHDMSQIRRELDKEHAAPAAAPATRPATAPSAR